MSLWGKEEDPHDVPPALRGKKPAEIAAMLQEAEENRRKLEEAAAKVTDLETKLQTRDSEFDTIKAKLADVEQRLTPQPETPLVDEPASPWTDPHKFVQDTTKPLATIALTSGMMTAKMYFSQGLTERDRKIFRKYEKEVEQGVNTFAPEARVMPQSWFNMFMYVKGLHEAEIREAETKQTDFFAETPSRGAGGDDPPTEEKLTAEEEALCRSMRWDPKAYLATKKKGTLAATERGAKITYGVNKH
jgi:hypothetical protein